MKTPGSLSRLKSYERNHIYKFAESQCLRGKISRHVMTDRHLRLLAQSVPMNINQPVFPSTILHCLKTLYASYLRSLQRKIWRLESDLELSSSQ